MKCYGNFNHITQIVHSNAHLNPLKCIFSDKLLPIVEILSFQFAEIFNSQEMWPRKVLNFSHVCFSQYMPNWTNKIIALISSWLFSINCISWFPQSLDCIASQFVYRIMAQTHLIDAKYCCKLHDIPHFASSA